MSWQAVDAVLKHSQSKGSARLLLLCIAHHAGPGGTGAHPSLETLSDETKIDLRRVRRLVRDLEKIGELNKATGGGRLANEYTLLLPIGPGSQTWASQPQGLPNQGVKTQSEGASAPSQQTVVVTDVVALTKSKTTLALELENAGVASSVAMDLANRHPERIPIQLACLEDRKPKDAAATLVAAIRGNWAPPAAYLKREAAERAQEAEREAKARAIAAQSATRQAQEVEEARQAEEAARLDAYYGALDDQAKADLETEVEKRLEILAPPLRTEFARQMMRRELLKGQEHE